MTHYNHVDYKKKVSELSKKLWKNELEIKILEFLFLSTVKTTWPENKWKMWCETFPQFVEDLRQSMFIGEDPPDPNECFDCFLYNFKEFEKTDFTRTQN